MRGSSYDVSSNGLTKTVTVQHGAQAVNPGVTSNDIMSATLSTIFESGNDTLALIFGFIAFWIAVRPQIYCAREFYRGCFCCRAWYGPWALWIWDLVWLIVDILSIISILDFFMTHPGGSTLHFVVVIVILIYVFVRYLWYMAFWNWHNTKAAKEGTPVFSARASYALGFAIFAAVLMLLCVLALFIAFGVARAWVAFVFLIPLLIWSLVILVWTALIYACIGTCPTACDVGYALASQKGRK